MARTVIDEAKAAYAKGSYSDVVGLLEPLVVRYRDSFQFYRLLGLACLRSGDMGGALTYLRRADQLSPGSEEMDLALAAIELRKRDSQAAVEAYLEVLEAHPKSRMAKAALDFLQKRGDEISLNALVDSGRIADFYPGKPKPNLLPPLLIAGGALAAACLVILLFPRLIAILQGPAPRADVQSVQLSGKEMDQPLQAAGSFLYIITEKDAIDSFERCKKLFQEYRDNAAVREANRLINSNASDYIKEKARQLKSMAQVPTFQNVTDVPSFKDVMASPALYDGCAVDWSGRLANVVSANSMTTFDFLVGYQDRLKVEGIVPVTFPASTGLDNDRPVQLLASVRSQGNSFRLEGISVHDLSYAGKK